MNMTELKRVDNQRLESIRFHWNIDNNISKNLKKIQQELLLNIGFTFPKLNNARIFKITANNKKTLFGKSTIINHGNSSNYIILNESEKKLAEIKIEFLNNSNNNLIVIGNRINLRGEILFKGSNNISIFSGENIKPVKLKVDFNNAQNALFFWGKGSTSSGAGNRAIIRGKKVKCMIADDCMFSHNITLRTSDMHTIFDINSKNRINEDGDVIINSHVWIGQDVLVLKGTSIGLGSIIGSKSLVTQNIPPYSVAAGTPAKIIRDNCSWDRMDYVRQETLDYIKSISSLSE